MLRNVTIRGYVTLVFFLVLIVSLLTFVVNDVLAAPKCITGVEALCVDGILVLPIIDPTDDQTCPNT